MPPVFLKKSHQVHSVALSRSLRESTKAAGIWYLRMGLGFGNAAEALRAEAREPHSRESSVERGKRASAAILRSQPALLLPWHLWRPQHMRPHSTWHRLLHALVFSPVPSLSWHLLPGSQWFPGGTEPQLPLPGTSSVTFGLAFLLPCCSLPTMAFPRISSPKKLPAWKTTFGGPRLTAALWDFF